MFYIININHDSLLTIPKGITSFHDLFTINEKEISVYFYFHGKKNIKKAVLEDLKNTVNIAFRAKGFIIFNFDKEYQVNMPEKIIDFIKMDEYNRGLLKGSELCKNEISFPSAQIKDVLDNLNKHSFFTENKIVLTEKNIQKAWEIKKIIISGKDEKAPMYQNIEKLIIEEVDKYQERIYAYVLCKGDVPTDYRKLANVESDPDEFIHALINYKLRAEGLAEKHVHFTKNNQKVTTLFFEHIETVRNEPKNIGMIIGSFVDGYTLILCFNEQISSGILMGMISTIERKLKRR